MEKYSKIKVIGKGSFGSATLIKRRSDGQLLVVKEVNMQRMNTKEREEARHEVRVLQKLQHPNITQFLERIEKKGMLYIVMEYADGGDLHQKIEAAKKTRGFLKEELILHYFSQLCLAIDYLHCQHILHRDIKAMNVFLTAGGTVKLGDFGISTVLRNTLGMANTVCGTPYYFSPELCRNKPYNNKSDVWAMGIILYELVTLKHAFDGNSMQQLLQRISKGSYSPLPATVHPGIREMIQSCLQKDPAKRPTIKQLLMNDVMRGALSKLSSDLDIAQLEQKALKEVIPRDPQVDDESQRVLKAKLAGERAAKAVAPKQPAAPAAPAAHHQQPPVGRYGVYDQALEQQRQQQQPQRRSPHPQSGIPGMPLHQGQYRGPQPRAQGAMPGGNPIDVKAAMGDLDNFLKHLGRPTDQIAHEALRREREDRQRQAAEQDRANEKARMEREKAEKVRMWEDRQKKERERLREAAARARAQQADLDKAMNNHKERMKVAQEKEKERRDDLKKQIAAKEKKKDADKHKEKLAQQNRAAAAAAQRNQQANGALQQHRANLQANAANQQPHHQGAQPNLQPQVDKVQNWAAKQNEKNKELMEAKKMRKLEEEKLAVAQMDAQAIRAQRMKHKVLDPELEAWVNREIKKSEAAGPIQRQQENKLKAHNNGKSEEVRRSIDHMDQVLAERGEHKNVRNPNVPKLIEVPGLRLAANGCSTPNHPTTEPRHKYPKTTDPTSAALFPPLGPRTHSSDEAQVGSSGRSPQPDVSEPFMAKPRLNRSGGGSAPPEVLPDVLDAPVRHMQPGGKSKAIAGRRMADRRPNAGLGKLALQPDDLKAGPKVADPRRGSAPPVMRTPTKHVDVAPLPGNSPQCLELEAETKYEDIPTPVRQWMDQALPLPGKNQPPAHPPAIDKNASNASSGQSSNPNSKQASSNLSGPPPHQNSRTLSPNRHRVVSDDEYVDEVLVNGEAMPPSARDPGVDVVSGDPTIMVDEVETGSDYSDGEVDEVDLNPIVESAMASPAAARQQQNEYSLMRSHIQDLLTASQMAKKQAGSPRHQRVRSTESESEDTSQQSSRQSSSQVTPAGSPQHKVNHVPFTPPPRNPPDPRGPGIARDRARGIRSTSPPAESFGDAEPITPSAIRNAVRGRPTNAVHERVDSKASGGSEEEEEELEEEEGALVLQDSSGAPQREENEDVDDMSETALQRVAAICGEAFTGTQPCHLDGRPFFETPHGHAEALREYLEEVLGISTLTTVYSIIGELLDPPVDQEDDTPATAGGNINKDENGRMSDFAMQSYQTQVGGVMKRAIRLVMDHIGEEAATEALVDESITLVAQLVYFDAEAFTS